ncbi:MAG: hypothetical protein E7434_08035 [Ruminococcaceae bacterium]|nr:hypothetical protein [Oscillospiraceae bacterium]
MKRFLPVVFALIIFLNGCCVKDSVTFECVADSYEEIASPAFYLQAEIPQEAVLTDSCKDGCCAVFSHDDFEIYQEIFEAESLDAAVEELTGHSKNSLSMICLQTFPQEEYRFAYHAVGEEGTLSCSGKLFYDGDFCYAVTVLCPIENEPLYHEAFSDLLSLTTLQAV